MRKLLLALLILVAACHRHEPRRVVKLGASGPTVTWLDVSGTPTGALLALVRHFDSAFGVHGSLNGQPFHDRLPITHPTDPTRWALPLDARAATELSALREDCADAYTAVCGGILSLPAPTVVHDSSWQGSPPYWCNDAGTCSTPPQPTDSFPGQTP